MAKKKLLLSLSCELYEKLLKKAEVENRTVNNLIETILLKNN